MQTTQIDDLNHQIKTYSPSPSSEVMKSLIMTIQLCIAHTRTDLADIRADLLNNIHCDSCVTKDTYSRPMIPKTESNSDSSPTSVADDVAFKLSEV